MPTKPKKTRAAKHSRRPVAKKKARAIRTIADLLRSPLIGMWADRTDIFAVLGRHVRVVCPYELAAR